MCRCQEDVISVTFLIDSQSEAVANLINSSTSARLCETRYPSPDELRASQF